MSLELVLVFESPGLQLGPVFDVSGPPTFVSVTPTTTGATVAFTGLVTHYRVDGGAAVAVPGNPFTFSGLTPNTEPHTVELSGDGGSTWSAPWTFGTLNPGAGGGDIPTGIHLASALQFTLSGTSAASLAVQASSGATLQLTGSAQVSTGAGGTVSVSSSVTLVLAPSSAVSAAVRASSAATLQLSGGAGQLSVYDVALLRRVVAGKPAVRTVRGIAY